MLLKLIIWTYLSWKAFNHSPQIRTTQTDSCLLRVLKSCLIFNGETSRTQWNKRSVRYIFPYSSGREHLLIITSFLNTRVKSLALFYCCCWVRSFLLCSPAWSGTQSIGQARLEHVLTSCHSLPSTGITGAYSHIQLSDYSWMVKAMGSLQTSDDKHS